MADDWLRPPLREEGRRRRRRSAIMQRHLRSSAEMDGCRRDRITFSVNSYLYLVSMTCLASLHFYWVCMIEYNTTKKKCKKQSDASETSGGTVGTLRRSAVSHTSGFGQDMNNKQ